MFRNVGHCEKMRPVSGINVITGPNSNKIKNAFIVKVSEDVVSGLPNTNLILNVPLIFSFKITKHFFVCPHICSRNFPPFLSTLS